MKKPHPVVATVEAVLWSTALWYSLPDQTRKEFQATTLHYVAKSAHIIAAVFGGLALKAEDAYYEVVRN